MSFISPKVSRGKGLSIYYISQVGGGGVGQNLLKLTWGGDGMSERNNKGSGSGLW